MDDGGEEDDGKDAADPVQPDADAELVAGTAEWKKAIKNEFEEFADKLFDALVDSRH